MKKYWVCIIGAIEKDELPEGADFPMRQAVQKAYIELTGKDNNNCWSGWGTSEKGIEKLLSAWNESR